MRTLCKDWTENLKTEFCFILKLLLLLLVFLFFLNMSIYFFVKQEKQIFFPLCTLHIYTFYFNIFIVLKVFAGKMTQRIFSDSFIILDIVFFHLFFVHFPIFPLLLILVWLLVILVQKQQHSSVLFLTFLFQNTCT